MAEERCPRCFSEINITAPDWTNDPIKTPKGEAGDEYKGFTHINPIHIQELQEIRAQQEEDLGFFSEDDTGYVEGGDNSKTQFTEIDTETNLVDIYKKHILELRESTEKILTALGQTKDTYFNYDENGTEYNIGDHQTDWKDTNLEAKKLVDIKAYHIEDLRHFLAITTLIENFTPNTVGIVNNIYGSFWITEQESGEPPSSFDDTQSRLLLLKREGNYLGTRLKTTQLPLPSPPYDPGDPGTPGWWSPYPIVTNIDYIDLDGNLTSNLYPQPQANKFTWSLYQHALPWSNYPFKSSYWGAVIGQWSGLVFIQTDFTLHRIYNFSNSKISFTPKVSGNNKDVLFESYLSASHDSNTTTVAVGGNFWHYLTYHFNTDNYFEGSNDTKISFEIENMNRGYSGDPLSYPGLSAGLGVYIRIIDMSQTGQPESILSYTGIIADGEYKILLNTLTTLPSIYRIKYIQFISGLGFNIAGKTLPSGTGWCSFKLVTPIKITK